MTVEVIWPDGHHDRAGTWRALEEHVRHDQWHRYGRLAFRLSMRVRAGIWSGSNISILATSRQFFRDLESAGMLRVITDEDATDA
jgi:hypothetical protein